MNKKYMGEKKNIVYKTIRIYGRNYKKIAFWL